MVGGLTKFSSSRKNQWGTWHVYCNTSTHYFLALPFQKSYDILSFYLKAFANYEIISMEAFLRNPKKHMKVRRFFLPLEHSHTRSQSPTSKVEPTSVS